MSPRIKAKVLSTRLEVDSVFAEMLSNASKRKCAHCVGKSSSATFFSEGNDMT
jgi:hypothetical protein